MIIPMKPYETTLIEARFHMPMAPKARVFIPSPKRRAELCLPDANAQPFIDGAGTAFVALDRIVGRGTHWES